MFDLDGGFVAVDEPLSKSYKFRIRFSASLTKVPEKSLEMSAIAFAKRIAPPLAVNQRVVSMPLSKLQ